MHISRSIQENIRENLSYDERENQEDNGLISAWEVGRNQAKKDEEFASKVINGALPVSVFKGGFKKKLDTIYFKYATFKYLAQLQGLKGIDLDIDTDRDDGLELVCSETGMKSIFSADINHFKD